MSVPEARDRILGQLPVLESELVDLYDVGSRVLAEDIAATTDVPPFANSSMDGFAVQSTSCRTATTDNPVRLEVSMEIAAGSLTSGTLRPGDCARIMTGAPLPSGADAVVPFEEVRQGDEAITFFHPVSPNSCVRPRGNDIRAGETVVWAGTELRAPHVGLLATLGLAQVPVVRRPVVAIVSTGDEVVEVGQPLRHGQIYNSNTPMLASAVREVGGLAHVVPVMRDDVSVITEALAAIQADLLITTGGASVGDFDHVRVALEASGNLDFWKVRMRPGKPLLFGHVRGMPVFGLPGNPTSAMVTFEQFVRPAIRTMLRTSWSRPELEVTVDEAIENNGGRRTFARVQLRREGAAFHARLAGSQDSAMLLPLAGADGLLEIPEEQERVLRGDIATVQVWTLPQ